LNETKRAKRNENGKKSSSDMNTLDKFPPVSFQTSKAQAGKGGGLQ
jgi:hypothetical protein